MINVLKECDFQRFFINYLKDENNFIIRKSHDFDKSCAMDCDLFFDFLSKTQPDTLSELKEVYHGDLNEIVSEINRVIKNDTGLLYALKHGVTISNIKVNLMYNKPANSFNDDLVVNYGNNILSVIEEVHASDKERVDLVIFLNGFAIMSFELKSNFSDQSYYDAIGQYKESRDPDGRLFKFNCGCLVNFAMDLENVYMTTKLDGDSTVFLPFNRGSGSGINKGAGNPSDDDQVCKVSYMWEDILTKDSIIELISKFIFLDEKRVVDENTGNIVKEKSLIFPRYHQRDVVHKILEDVMVNGSSKNYLIQHSAGSGKTKSIAWLAYRLASLHNESDEIIFDSVLIITDRIVVDRQLQDAINSLEHQGGFIKSMDNSCTSIDLAEALEGNNKIIISTIQKFNYIIDKVQSMQNKKFALIIDEAHSSTSGEEMRSVYKTLSSKESMDTPNQFIEKDMKAHGKQDNISTFAFTATPKDSTLNLFGRKNNKGQKEPFHIYSMKQAIEEKFILDVLKNYTTYETYCNIEKITSKDPKYKPREAMGEIKKAISLDDENIKQRVEIIIKHFLCNVNGELGGKSKAMIVTSSREAVVKYYLAIKKYIAEKHLDINIPLVAFTDKVKLKGYDGEFSEESINGFSADKLPSVFDKDENRILIVANKYQTGFDQPKLCAMYICKELRGVNAVQTLSRLNRTYSSNKNTFILDFENDYKDIKEAFSQYYTQTTLLGDILSVGSIYELELKINKYYNISMEDLRNFNKSLSDNNNTKELIKFIQSEISKIENIPEDERDKLRKLIHKFIRVYEFLTLSSDFKDKSLHIKYNLFSSLSTYLKSQYEFKCNLDGLIAISEVKQQKKDEYHKGIICENEIIHGTNQSSNIVSVDDKEIHLSEILKMLHDQKGKDFDIDDGCSLINKIKEDMINSSILKDSVKNNSKEEFRSSVFSNESDKNSFKQYLINNLVNSSDSTKDLSSLLIKDRESRERIEGIIFDDIYKGLLS